MDQHRNVSQLVASTSKFYIDDNIILICTWALYCVACQMVNIFGIVTNIINTVCFVKQGFNDSTNISLLGLSLSDLASLVTTAATCVFVCPALSAADLSFDNIGVAYLVSAIPHFAFTRVSSCITALITLERCLSISKPLQVKRIVTPQRTTTIVVCIFVIFTFSSTPIYVVNTFGTKFSFIRNKTIIGLIYKGGREDVEKLTLAANNFVIPLFTFVIITVCTLILACQLHSNAKWRNTNIPLAQGDKLSSRNQKVAKMVIFISTLFIVCLMPNTILLFAFAFEPGLFLNGKYVKLTQILTGFTYTMESMNCSMNIFIYYRMSTKYRATFHRMFIRIIN